MNLEEKWYQIQLVHVLLLTLTIILATLRRWRTVLHRFAARHSLGAHRAALQMYHYVRRVKNILLYPYTGITNLFLKPLHQSFCCTIEGQLPEINVNIATNY